MGCATKELPDFSVLGVPMDPQRRKVGVYIPCDTLCYVRGPRDALTLFTALVSSTTSARHLIKVLGHYTPSTAVYAACCGPDCKIHHHTRPAAMGVTTQHHCAAGEIANK
jgi:hypothetical protein